METKPSKAELQTLEGAESQSSMNKNYETLDVTELPPPPSYELEDIERELREKYGPDAYMLPDIMPEHSILI